MINIAIISDDEKYKNLLDLFNNLKSYQIDAYFLKTDISKYNFNIYYRKPGGKIYRNYDVLFALGNNKLVLKMAKDTKAKKKILINFEEEVKTKFFDKVITNYHDLMYTDINKFKSSLPVTKLKTNDFTISMLDPIEIDHPKLNIKVHKFNNLDLFDYLETKIYYFQNKGPEDLSNALKCYILGSYIMEDFESNLIGINTISKSHFNKFKYKKPKNNLKAYNRYAVNLIKDIIDN